MFIKITLISSNSYRKNFSHYATCIAPPHTVLRRGTIKWKTQAIFIKPINIYLEQCVTLPNF